MFGSLVQQCCLATYVESKSMWKEMSLRIEGEDVRVRRLPQLGVGLPCSTPEDEQQNEHIQMEQH